MWKILILSVITFIVACEGKTTFTELPKHAETGVYDRDDGRKGKKYVYQSVLVRNPSGDKKNLAEQLSFYHLENKKIAFSDAEVITFSTLFYIENHKTSYFINAEDDPGGFSSEILIDYYDEFGIAEAITHLTDNPAQLKTEIIFNDR